MTSIEQKVQHLTEEVKELKHEVRKLKKTLVLDATKVEVWIAIDVASEYHISSFGRVWRRRDDFYPKVGLDKNTGYSYVYLNSKRFQLHRLLAKAFIPNPEGKPYVDHKDGNPQNNCLSNLRWASYVENGQNKRRQKNNTSGYTGVTFDNERGKWIAQIWVDRKYKYLGRFHTKEEASAVYEEAAKELHGEFFCNRR